MKLQPIRTKSDHEAALREAEQLEVLSLLI